MKSHFLALLAVVALALPACSTTKKSQPAGLAARAALTATRSSVQSVRHATAAVKAATATTRAKIESAQSDADRVAQSFVELRGAIESLPRGMEVARALYAAREAEERTKALQASLAAAQEANALTTQQASIADSKAANAEETAALADAKVEHLVQEDARKADRIERLEDEKKVESRLKWKWRVLAVGSWLAFIGFFVARQYFPILKLF